jgi:hypothetical protein
MTMRTTTISTVLFCALPFAQASTSFLITNGTFETGNTSGWTATTGAPFMDVAGSCNDGFAAQTSATGCMSGIGPLFGSYAAYSSTSFPTIANNVGEWDNFLSQNFTVPTGGFSNATLSLDYTATWSGSGTFRGVVVAVGILQGSTHIDNIDLVVNPSSNGTVGWTLSSTDLTALLSAYAGDTLTLQLGNFIFYDTRGTDSFSSGTSEITGFDNVQVAVTSSTPEPGTIWMAAGGIFLVLASRVARRRA